MDIKEVKERTKKKTGDNVESKKHKREKGAVLNVTREPTPKCGLPWTSPSNLMQELGWNIHCQQVGIAKRNELWYRYLRSGHQGKNCLENNHCGINDCTDTHHFHLNFERRSDLPERVDVAVETRSALRDSEFAGHVVLQTDPVWLIGSEGQSIQVNAFLDDWSDSTYVRDDNVTALGLKTVERTLRLTTLTESCILIKSKKVSLVIKSLNGETQSTVEAWTNVSRLVYSRLESTQGQMGTP